MRAAVAPLSTSAARPPVSLRMRSCTSPSTSHPRTWPSLGSILATQSVCHTLAHTSPFTHSTSFSHATGRPSSCTSTARRSSSVAGSIRYSRLEPSVPASMSISGLEPRRRESNQAASPGRRQPTAMHATPCMPRLTRAPGPSRPAWGTGARRSASTSPCPRRRRASSARGAAARGCPPRPGPPRTRSAPGWPRSKPGPTRGPSGEAANGTEERGHGASTEGQACCFTHVPRREVPCRRASPWTGRRVRCFRRQLTDPPPREYPGPG